MLFISGDNKFIQNPNFVQEIGDHWLVEVPNISKYVNVNSAYFKRTSSSIVQLMRTFHEEKHEIIQFFMKLIIIHELRIVLN